MNFIKQNKWLVIIGLLIGTIFGGKVVINSAKRVENLVGSTIFSVYQGGTGAATFTANAILKGNGLNPITASGISIDSSNNISGIVNFTSTGTTTLNGVTYTWPAADGGANQRLTTNGSGTLSWATVSGGGGGGTQIGLREGFGSALFTNFSSVSFDSGAFNLNTSNPDARLFLDYTNGPASRSIAQTISGQWSFTKSPLGLTVSNDASVSRNFEIGGYASVSGAFTQNTGTASNSFAGSLNVTKGVHGTGNLTTSSLFLGTGTGSNSFAGSLNALGGATFGASVGIGSGTITPRFLLDVGGIFFGGGNTTGVKINGTTIASNYGPGGSGVGDIPLTVIAVGASNLTLGGGSLGGNILLTPGNVGINSGGAVDTKFEVGGTASISGTLTLAGIITSSNTGSNTFSGSLTVSKGINANAIVGTNLTINTGNITDNGTGSSSFAGSLNLSKGFTATSYQGAGLTNCTGSSNAIQYQTGQFSCGAISGGSGITAFPGIANNQIMFFKSTTVASGSSQLNWDTTNKRLGINSGANIDTRFEVGGTASISGLTTFGDSASVSVNFEVKGYASASQLFVGKASNSFGGGAEPTTTGLGSWGSIAKAWGQVVANTIVSVIKLIIPNGGVGGSAGGGTSGSLYVNTTSNSFSFGSGGTQYVLPGVTCKEGGWFSPQVGDSFPIAIYNYPTVLTDVLVIASSSNNTNTSLGFNVRYGTNISSGFVSVFTGNHNASSSTTVQSFSPYLNNTNIPSNGVALFRVSSVSAETLSFRVSLCGRYSP